MNREAKGIIFTLNILVSALLTELLVRYGFFGMTGWRLMVVIVAGFVFLFRVLEDIEEIVLERGMRNDKSGKGKSKRGTVPGIVWYKNRLPKAEPKDRYSRLHTPKVQKDAGVDYIGSVVSDR